MQLNVKQKPFHIVCVLDNSGSMAGSQEKAVTSYNEFVSSFKEKQAHQTCYVSLYFFNTELQVVYERVDINEVQPLQSKDFVVGGMTALHDAIGITINKFLSEDNVFFVVDTDGYENSSKEYKPEGIRSLIESQTNAGWDFTFLGADLSKEETATISSHLGFNASASATFSKDVAGYTARTMYMANKLDAYATTVANKLDTE